MKERVTNAKPGGPGRQDVYQSRDRRCERVFSGGDACPSRTCDDANENGPNALPPARPDGTDAIPLQASQDEHSRLGMHP